MVNKIILGIANGIRKVYPEAEYEVYTEGVEQGIEEPCFFILCITQNHEGRLQHNFDLYNSFDVHYYPKKGNGECWEVAEKLRSLLKYINVDGELIRGSKINCRIEDGVLHFFVDYNLRMKCIKISEEHMERVKVHGEIGARR